MRIIAGTKRGMKLLSPPGEQTRPITDRIKESLFNVLYNYGLPDGATAADLFCGTGSMGLEALSRGARNVTFVEMNTKVIDTLKKNIDRTTFANRSRTVRANAFKTGAAVRPGEPKCDLVFVDPPYLLSRDTGEKAQLGRLLMLLNDQMTEGGIVSVRTHKQTDLLGAYGRLRAFDIRKWGTMKITLLRYADAAEDVAEIPAVETAEPEEPDDE